MRVYIGAPIDTANYDPKRQFEELAGWVLKGLGPDCVIYNPVAAFVNAGVSRNLDDLLFLERINEAALKTVDLGVFVWNGSPSYGVPLEIRYLINEEIPVILLNTTGKLVGTYLRAAAMARKIRAILDTPEQLIPVLQGFNRKDGVLSEDDGEI